MTTSQSIAELLQRVQAKRLSVSTGAEIQRGSPSRNDTWKKQERKTIHSLFHKEMVFRQRSTKKEE